MFLWRPVVSDPPVYTMADLHSWVTLHDVMNAHEVLDLRGAMGERVREDRPAPKRR